MPFSDHYICTECIDHYAIKEYIESIGAQQECSYCEGGIDEVPPLAAPFYDIVEYILEGIKTEWGDPGDEGIGWESKEGGWQWDVHDTYDLLMEVLEIPFATGDLFKDMVKALPDHQWCEKDPYGPQLGDQWLWDWQHFCRLIKHQTRYVFFKLPKAEKKDWHEPDDPCEILDEIGRISIMLDLVVELPVGSEFYRVRTHEAGVNFTTVAELGPPPLEHATSPNRMSPAGIPMFYGAFDQETALAETVKKSDKYATMVKFESLKTFKVIDLTLLPYLPSIFDVERRHLRPTISFMSDFITDLSKPVEKNGQEHIEYVPTQVVTEYFKHIFTDEDKDMVKGILYPSSISEGGKCCALFFNDKNCVQDSTGIHDNSWLSLASASITTINL